MMSDEDKIAALEAKIQRQEAINDQVLEALIDLWGVSVVLKDPDRSRYLERLDTALTKIIDLKNTENG